MTPLVSCLMPTYNRAPDYLHLIEEAVESFLLQDYPHKELVILNDTPGQELFCDSPGVRVINLHARCASLGGKRNLLARLAKGELLCPWDDDDISLPWRISQSVSWVCGDGWFWDEEWKIKDVKVGKYHYWNPQRQWYLPKEGLISNHSHGVCHNASIFTKKIWEKTGGYPDDASGDEDALMDTVLKQEVKELPRPLSDDYGSWSYIYRWNVSPVHVSGSYPHKDFYKRIGEMPIVTGKFEINPQWKVDYVELCRNHR